MQVRVQLGTYIRQFAQLLQLIVITPRFLTSRAYDKQTTTEQIKFKGDYNAF